MRVEAPRNMTKFRGFEQGNRSLLELQHAKLPPTDNVVENKEEETPTHIQLNHAIVFGLSKCEVGKSGLLEFPKGAS